MRRMQDACARPFRKLANTPLPFRRLGLAFLDLCSEAYAPCPGPGPGGCLVHKCARCAVCGLLFGAMTYHMAPWPPHSGRTTQQRA
eukprot:scaffold22545_cov126-Isochrysis_galbana.AAC.15